MSDLFYSNCLIQALKAKVRNPKRVKITYVSPFANEVFCPHLLWSDGVNDYDFGIEGYLNWYQRLWFKGHIRIRPLGFNERYKKTVEISKKGARNDEWKHL